MMEEIKEEIVKFAESCTLKDDIDDRCFSAAYAGVLKGLELSTKYSKEEINRFIESIG